MELRQRMVAEEPSPGPESATSRTSLVSNRGAMSGGSLTLSPACTVNIASRRAHKSVKSTATDASERGQFGGPVSLASALGPENVKGAGPQLP
jgi:hypothetical protein